MIERNMMQHDSSFGVFLSELLSYIQSTYITSNGGKAGIKLILL